MFVEVPCNTSIILMFVEVPCNKSITFTFIEVPCNKSIICTFIEVPCNTSIICTFVEVPCNTNIIFTSYTKQNFYDAEFLKSVDLLNFPLVICLNTVFFVTITRFLYE